MKYEKGSFITVPSREVLRGLNPIAQSLYMWLCSYANESGNCFPSRATLAKDVGCSDNSIDRMLDILLEKGLIQKETRLKNGEKQTNLYTVIVRGGSPTRSLPSPTQGVGVAPHRGIELNLVLTQSTEGGAERENEPEDRISSRVIPNPYSVGATKEKWSDGELRLQVLNWYFAESGLWNKATSKVRLQALMRRHNNAAVRIARAEWSPSELKAAKKQIDNNNFLQGEWTLETLEKYLTK